MIPTSFHVFWFSPVYHTRLLALCLGRSLSAACSHIPVHSHDLTAHAEPVQLEKDHLAILAIPVYGGRVPPLAIKRLQKIKGNHSPAIILASYGNRAYEDALSELRELATHADLVPIAAAACIARHTIGLIFAEGRPDADDLAELEQFAQKIASQLGGELKPVDVPGNVPTRPAPVFPLPQAVNENCVLCGHCWEKCPAQAIAPNQPAEINTACCICCMRCVAICPEGARIPDAAFMEGIRKKLAPLCAERKANEFFLAK